VVRSITSIMAAFVVVLALGVTTLPVMAQQPTDAAATAAADSAKPTAEKNAAAKLADKATADKPAVDKKAVDKKAVDKKAVDKKAVDKKAVDKKAIGKAGKTVEKPEEVKKTLKFDQEKAAANMRELEDRMIKLGELLRDAEPEDSARLLLGVQKAREKLILEQMREATAMIESLDLSQATEEQKAIIVKLQQLKELLLNADLDLQLKLDQLKQIQEARRQLAELKEREQKQKDQTDQANKDSKDAKPLQSGEQRNQKAGESLKQKVGSINGASKASESIGEAGESMGGASECLGNGNCQGAAKSQQEAVDKLAEADKQLEKLEQQIREKAEAAARQRVMELLAEMIDRQTKIQFATAESVPLVAAKNPGIAGRLHRLATAEDKVVALASECIEICELTQFSFALPEAMKGIRGRMQEIRSELEQARADDDLVALEASVVEDLSELMDAMKQAAKPSRQNNSKCKGGCCGNKNKLLAEVRMLLWMQKTVSRETRRVDRLIKDEKISPEELQRRTEELHQQQEKVREITDKLRELTTPEFVKGNVT
jgi:hypothetical protein